MFLIRLVALSGNGEKVNRFHPRRKRNCDLFSQSSIFLGPQTKKSLRGGEISGLNPPVARLQLNDIDFGSVQLPERPAR